MYRRWIEGLLRARYGRILGTMAGIAVTVAFLATLGAFLRTSAATMTARAVASVAIDWQVELLPNADPAAVDEALRQAAPVKAMLPVGYADVGGFEASVGGTTQTTGAGKVLGLDAAYFSAMPGQVRPLLGPLAGVLLTQQTAANLHVEPGGTVVVHRLGLSDVSFAVDGVVDLPNADQMFQAVGAPAGAGPRAPPDNVMILPSLPWHESFDPQRSTRPDSIHSQIHLRLMHSGLPQDPVAASIVAGNQGRNLESRVAGAALLANNLAARLEAVREDALYAKLLFLFLGAPGVALAALMTAAVAAAGNAERQRDHALLRLRGATLSQVFGFAWAETLMVGLGGAILGVMLSELAGRFLLQTSTVSPKGLLWTIVAAVAGIGLAAAVVLWPTWRNLRGSTVTEARRDIGMRETPLWARVYLDVAFLVLAGIAFWRSAAAGYQVVLAPEGVAATAVDYGSFLAPFLLWAGLGLLTIRLVEDVLRRGRPAVARVLLPLAGRLSDVVAATFARQSRRLTAGVALAALAFAFASSTAIFNRTYEHQTLIDAELTNGADVAVTGAAAAPASAVRDKLAALPGVVAAQPMQHRFAYVGSDLQDLYGIDPNRIDEATNMSDAFFAGGNARATLAELARTPDGVLVSQETVNDYQLGPGDSINLRLQNQADHQYHVVPFHLVGVVREFPTAPKDSFLVANATYVAAQTGSAASEIILLRTNRKPALVVSEARAAVASLPGVKVSGIDDAVQGISSSLTAVDLAGLTRLELSFALVMVAAAAGLVLALGLAERQRSFEILVAVGARPRQLGAFVWGEAGLVLVGGASIGLASGWLVAEVLVKLLTGVFDPPPEAIAVPWIYLAAVLGGAALAVAVAAIGFTVSAGGGIEGWHEG